MHISNVDRHRDSAPVPKISAVWTGQMQIIWSPSRLVDSPLMQFGTPKQFDYKEWSVYVCFCDLKLEFLIQRERVYRNSVNDRRRNVCTVARGVSD